MRIGLDVRYISHALIGGVRTYVYHLARELPRCAPQHEFFFYADAKAPFELTQLPRNVVLRVLPWRGPLSSIRNDARLGRWMERDGVALAHCPGNYGPKMNVPLVVTVHDALNLFPMSQHLRGFGRRPRQVALMWYLGRMTRSTLERACRVITVSEHARGDIAARSGYPIDRIDVIYEAAAEQFTGIADQSRLERCRAKFGLGPRIVLADGIKNPAAVITAYRELPEHLRRTTELVFFSREPVPRPPVAEALQQSGVRFIPQPEAAELVGLMNLASVFAFPSWHEGFGLPLVEAMQCGAPIVASSRASIPEILGDAGLIFDLEEPGRFTEHLRCVLEHESIRRELSGKALRQARRFSWRDTARQTVAVYERVALALRRTA
jgi:glycosyltransferase involved in cell wall biosynthesis